MYSATLKSEAICSSETSIFSEPTQLTAYSCWFLLGLLFNPEDGGDVFYRNIGLSPYWLSLLTASEGFLHGFLFSPKAGDHIFLRNIGLFFLTGPASHLILLASCLAYYPTWRWRRCAPPKHWDPSWLSQLTTCFFSSLLSLLFKRRRYIPSIRQAFSEWARLATCIQSWRWRWYAPSTRWSLSGLSELAAFFCWFAAWLTLLP
jgi:hypothetical protein